MYIKLVFLFIIFQDDYQFDKLHFFPKFIPFLRSKFRLLFNKKIN